ncbi:MAG: acyltransferase family protein [Holophagaceae bacterium]|nr:acyltransferase family protein [Holophagaceae bacterium]
MPDPGRNHAFDAVRAFALTAGVVLHGTMSFLPNLTSLGWPIADRSQSEVLPAVFYAIHAFRMHAFFLIAGFFARPLLHRRGTSGFLRDRTRRVLAPFVAGWVILLPLTGLVLLWAALKTSGGDLESLKRAHPGVRPGSGGLPLIHLWFLYDLSLFYGVALASREALRRWLDPRGTLPAAADRVLRSLSAIQALPLLLAVPMGAALAFTANRGWLGVPMHLSGLKPPPAALVAYGTAFAAGWFLNRQPELLASLARRWAFHAVLAAALLALAWRMVGAPLPFGAPVPAAVRLPYAVVYALAAWTSTFAVLGAGLKFAAAESPVRRYLADASYWIYLVHLPLVFGLQTLVMHLDLPWTLKFPLLLGVAFALLLGSYHVLVRRTFLAAWLGGRGTPAAAVSGAAMAEAPDAGA